MPIPDRGSTMTVRRGSPWMLPPTAYFVIFLSVAAATYWWSGHRSTRVEPASAAGAQTASAQAQAAADAAAMAWKAEKGRAYATARQAAAHAERELREAQSQLDDLLRRQLEAARQVPPKPQPVPAAPPPAAPVLVENPEWAASIAKARELEQRRAQLLVDRLPRHPAVQEVEARLDEIRHRLAVISQQIPMTPAEPPQPVEPRQPEPSPAVAGPDPAEIARAQRAVDQAGRQQDSAAQAEQLAWQTLNHGPPKIEIEPPKPVLQPEPPPPSGTAPWLAALIAGLTTITGLAMISAGAGLEPPLATVAGLREVVAVPVVGVLPATSRSRSAGGRWRRWVRSVLIAGGVLMVGGWWVVGRW
jgi:hypothetical protein